MNKQFIASLCVLAMVGMAVGVGVQGADEGNVAATVSVKEISLTVGPDIVDYGTLAFTENASTAADYFTATNTGNVSADFSVRGAEATVTGGPWDLVTSIVNVDEFKHSVTGDTLGITEQFLTDTSASWASDITASGGTQKFSSTFYMPNTGSAGTGEIATTYIYVVATEHGI